MWGAAYQLMRALKWLLWAGFLGYSLYFVLNPAPHLTQFGHLTLQADIAMFGLPLAAVAAGLFELMFRDRTGGRGASNLPTR
jgi:polyferredoxin